MEKDKCYFEIEIIHFMMDTSKNTDMKIQKCVLFVTTSTTFQ